MGRTLSQLEERTDKNQLTAVRHEQPKSRLYTLKKLLLSNPKRPDDLSPRAFFLPDVSLLNLAI
jgi:hypothetical protein